MTKRGNRMKGRALLLLLGLGWDLAACSRHHGNIISIANNEELAALANESAANSAAANVAAANVAGNAQNPPSSGK